MNMEAFQELCEQSGFAAEQVDNEAHEHFTKLLHKPLKRAVAVAMVTASFGQSNVKIPIVLGKSVRKQVPQYEWNDDAR